LPTAVSLALQPRHQRPPSPAPDRFPLDPVFLFRASLPIEPDVAPAGETPDGLRLYFGLGKGGTVHGPALTADVIGRDGDRLRVRLDGIGAVDVEATLRTSQGDIVVMIYSGLVDTGPDGYAALLSGHGPKSAPVRFAPRFLTSSRKLDWLNRIQGFAIGEVSLERLRVDYDVYAFGPADLPI
jgi:hypothetical protein